MEQKLAFLKPKSFHESSTNKSFLDFSLSRKIKVGLDESRVKIQTVWDAHF